MLLHPKTAWPTEGAFLSLSPFSPFSRSPVGKEKKGRGRREVPRELSNSANFIRRRHSGGLWKRREKGGGRQNVAWEGRRGGGEMRTRISPPPFPFPRRLCHCKPPFPALQLSRKSGKLLLQSLGAISPSVHCRFQSPSVRQSWLFLGFMLAKTSYISYLFGSSFLYASQLSSCQKVFCKSSALTIATEKSAYTLSHLLNVFRSNNSMLLQFAK